MLTKFAAVSLFVTAMILGMLTLLLSLGNAPTAGNPVAWWINEIVRLILRRPLLSDFLWALPVCAIAVGFGRLSTQLRVGTVIDLRSTQYIPKGWLGFLLAVVLLPPYEEAWFRVMFQNYGAPYTLAYYGVPYAPWLYKALAIIVQGAVFGFMHYSNPKLSPIVIVHNMIVGLFYGVTIEFSGSLFAVTAAHMSGNADVLLQLRKQSR